MGEGRGGRETQQDTSDVTVGVLCYEPAPVRGAHQGVLLVLCLECCWCWGEKMEKTNQRFFPSLPLRVPLPLPLPLPLLRLPLSPSSSPSPSPSLPGRCGEPHSLETLPFIRPFLSPSLICILFSSSAPPAQRVFMEEKRYFYSSKRKYEAKQATPPGLVEHALEAIAKCQLKSNGRRVRDMRAVRFAD